MKKQQKQSRQYALQGFLLGLLPASMLAGYAENQYLPDWTSHSTAILSAWLLLAGTGLIFRHTTWAKRLFSAGILLNLAVLSFEFTQNPLLALFCLLLAIAAFYYLFTIRLYPAASPGESLSLERLIGCCSAGFLLSLASPLFAVRFSLFSVVCSVNLFIMLILLLKYWIATGYSRWKAGIKLLFLCAAVGIGFLTVRQEGAILTLFLMSPVLLILALKQKHADLKYLELIVAHPARCLALTFLGLCLAGTLLLRTPWAITGDLEILDAAFTAVSAVCVTGLTVIDISAELTISGQYFLLILIQLGGLGIMTLTTLILHSIGKLSLTGEQLITELTQSSDQDIFDSLRLILRYTFIVEFTGAVLLFLGFFNFHGNWLLALHQGIFTSISAFCNAGFFPGADSLIPYAGEKLLLTVVALEIICGGIAPAMIYSIVNVRRYHQIPMISKMVLGTTGFLVASGTGLLLLFEWNGIFGALTWHDKLINGFFQSVTLRTAGFNTVPFSALGAPAYLIMIMFMFIGGSPGGTAGGIKTTTLAVLTLAFRAAVRNDDSVTVGTYRLSWRAIVQSIAIFMAAGMVLFCTVLMLVTTQSASADKLIFEAVSALATVGLSLNCTGELDSVGRLIIMSAMFIGRIGPLTLFCILSEKHNSGKLTYPQINIPLG